MSGINISCQALSGGQSYKIAVSSVSAQSVALTCTNILITPSVDTFMRMGENPTALADGTDQILIAGNTYRVQPIISGQKLAFVSVDAGFVYLTPDA